MELSFLRKPLVIGISALFLQGCYTLQQGLGQVKLLARREPIEKVLAQKLESESRLEKLRMVPEILQFAEANLALEVGGSYRKYVKLDGDSVTYVLQVAERRALKRKTWWFPLVGSQPYLGFFQRKDAEAERDSWKAKNYDTSLGGVEAFSLLGYLDDPLYSSMLDNNSLLELAETLIHECLHRTVYIANEFEFNENLADFVGRKGASLLAQKLQSQRSGLDKELEEYQSKYQLNLEAQRKFQAFLPIARKKLEEFYQTAGGSEEEFLSNRKIQFQNLRTNYLEFMNGIEKGSYYEHRFVPERFNNAVFLGYTLYEAHQAPFEELYLRLGSNLKEFVSKVKTCFEKKPSQTSRQNKPHDTTNAWAYEVISQCGAENK